MKRFPLFLFLLLTLAPAHAQLGIRRVDDAKAELYTLAAAWNLLHEYRDTWHLVMKTDGPADDNIWIKIGDNLEDAITSVLQLEDVLKDLGDGDCFEVKDKDGEGVYVTNYQPLIKKQGFKVQGEHRIGTAYLNTGSVTRAKVILLTERNVRYQKLNGNL